MAALCLLLLTACTTSGAPSRADEPGSIRVASFDFAESRLLAELFAAALESAGLPVARRMELGPREVVEPALEQGHVDLVPEYAGSALHFLTGQTSAADAVRTDLDAALRRRGLRALAFAPGQDQNGVVVSAETARRHELVRVSDLRRVAAGLTFAGPPECSERPLCLLGLTERYGLRFSAFVPFESRAATAESLLAGQVDVGMLETVDAYLGDGRLVLLEDDLALQPPENVVPVVRAQVLAEHGERLTRVMDALLPTLTTDALVELDRQVVLEGRPVGAVATEWVRAHHIA